MLFALNWTHRDRDCVDLACKEYPIWISSKIMLGWDGMSKEIFVSLNIYSFLLYTLTLHADFLCVCIYYTTLWEENSEWERWERSSKIIKYWVWLRLILRKELFTLV